MAGKILIFLIFCTISVSAQIRLPIDTISNEVQYVEVICIDKSIANLTEENLELYLKSNFTQGTFKTMKWINDSVSYSFYGWRTTKLGKKNSPNIKLWVQFKLYGTPDYLVLSLDDFATQDFESNEIPNPDKKKLSDLYHKYHKKVTSNGDSPVLGLYLETFDEQIKTLQGELVTIITTNCQ